MSMVSMVVGGTTDTQARFTVKVDTGPAAVRYDTDAGMSSPTTSSSETVDADGVATVEVTGLTAGTRYHWQTVDNGTPDTGTTGQFVTHPAAAGSAGSFTLGMATCARGDTVPGTGFVTGSTARVSNHPVFATIADYPDLLGFIHGGDFHYWDLGSGNHGVTGGAAQSSYRTAYDDVLAQSNQARLYREVATIYAWDDHDFGPNDSDGTFVSKANAAQVYRERWPHHVLEESTGPIYHSVPICRTLVVVADVRYDRSPNGDTDNASKTMLGAAQKSWLDSLLGSTGAEFLIWVMPSQWLGTSSDSWASFTTERTELVEDILVPRGFAPNRMCILSGDAHAVGYASHARNPHGGFPVFQFASLDSTVADGDSGAGIYDRPLSRGPNRWGTLRVDDDGSMMRVTGAPMVGNTPLDRYTMVAGSGLWTPRPAQNPSHVIAL